MVNVICMKWGTKFGADYVNRLYGMVRRNLRLPHRFVCFTDDSQGLVEGVEHFPMPDAGVVNGDNSRGWRKVTMFAGQLGDLSGPTLFLDLDVVVTGPLDPLFTMPGTACVIRDYRLLRVRGDTWVGNTSVFRFEAGQHEQVLSHLVDNFSDVRKRFRNEQEYVSHWFHTRDELRYWPSEWCPSFKHHCVAKGLLSYFRDPVLPEGARIVVFHGNPQPEQAMVGQGGKWYRRVRPTEWVSRYWHCGLVMFLMSYELMD